MAPVAMVRDVRGGITRQKRSETTRHEKIKRTTTFMLRSPIHSATLRAVAARRGPGRLLHEQRPLRFEGGITDADGLPPQHSWRRSSAPAHAASRLRSRSETASPTGGAARMAWTLRLPMAWRCRRARDRVRASTRGAPDHSRSRRWGRLAYGAIKPQQSRSAMWNCCPAVQYENYRRRHGSADKRPRDVPSTSCALRTMAGAGRGEYGRAGVLRERVVHRSPCFVRAAADNTSTSKTVQRNRTVSTSATALRSEFLVNGATVHLEPARCCSPVLGVNRPPQPVRVRRKLKLTVRATRRSRQAIQPATSTMSRPEETGIHVHAWDMAGQ